MEIDVRVEEDEERDDSIQIRWGEVDLLRPEGSEPGLMELYDEESQESYYFYEIDIDNLIRALKKYKSLCL